MTLFLHRTCSYLWSQSSHYHPPVCLFGLRTLTRSVAWSRREAPRLIGFTCRKPAGLKVTTGQLPLDRRLGRNAPLPPLETSSRHSHRYLASVELLQDRPLIRVLRHDSLRMELLEREWVDGADIVFDCDTALVFAPLFQVSLPSSFRSLKDRLSSLSWRYTDLAIIFKLDEASISGLQRSQDGEEGKDLFARVIRSIKKLQRELALAEAYAIKRPQTLIQMFFVRSVEQAAATARLLGNVAEARSQFSPWGDRLWLGLDEKEVSLSSLFFIELLEMSCPGGALSGRRQWDERICCRSYSQPDSSS